MPDTWVWKQPKDTAELLDRLLAARDLAVPERERENLCGCAYTALTEAESRLSAIEKVLIAACDYYCHWYDTGRASDAGFVAYDLVSDIRRALILLAPVPAAEEEK